MPKARVFFTSMRCSLGDSLLMKLQRLLKAGGFEEIDFRKKFAAIKIHFGEPGNLAFLRPNFARTVAQRIVQLKGHPFLTDCGTLYVGRRTDALSHLDAAYENGYGPYAAGCHIIIGDGLKGADELNVPVRGGVYVKSAKIGRAIMDADVVVSLNHFKGHEVTGFGGAIKNVGMGSGSRAGKMAMHNDSKPQVSRKPCVGCGECRKFCAQDAITIADGKATIDHDKCVGCGRCLASCPQHAIANSWSSGPERVSLKMTEYALAVLDGRPNYHINIVNQVSPYCDCHSESDAAVIPDIGIFCGPDIVAVDRASIDAVNRAMPLTGTLGEEAKVGNGKDVFTSIHPTTDWRSQLDHAEKIGLGIQDYELVTVK
ncbi:MAG: DUF362 domain-containing protein [Deltaproteobacteria bacterium]|jgi:uncharacterized Fe-S center protein|nr:DUF362 domain-containing protein [Deltaproteobacteria bacterium]